ncbi:uncharacterized protein LOC114759057 [Neltuma alba]|uniref:uncharacterized protein LOC114754005 n=1 Tax=Neltuma alba TaxID=207710 RepID=UPI0010A4E6C0|nr:uncharacterized protein LOC114754005 [Prosopis alba]XP_028803993.1 uncharacterized protein LOC114759057 [Prosopis alba]
MGNAMLIPCFHPNPNSSSSSSSVKLVFWEGTTRTLTGKKHIAGEIMFQFPEMMVCHADSFFIGQPIPALSIDDELMLGQTYFVLPIDRFGCGVLSAASLAALGSCPSRSPIKFGQCPFEYLKGSNGRALIKVKPEFITRLIVEGDQSKDDKEIIITGENNNSNDNSPSKSFLCSTPELQKHYEQLVRSKDQVWSPKLETISEHKIRFSPCRFIGLEWKEKEKSESNVY